MNLDEAQRKKVAEWIAQGLKLSDIQSKLDAELGIRLTYMEVRFLVDDLKLTPKDAERPKQVSSALAAPSAPAASPATDSRKPKQTAAAPAGVSVSVDQVTRAGAMASGQVVFSDGNRAEWYIDQMGRLGLAAQQPGYRPPAADVQQFQAALDSELAKLGF